jgi:hypothetical protein
MVLWFMRRKYVNDPTLFLHFCDYPLWIGLDPFIWINLNFPSCKNGLYQVWLKLVRCFILKDYFQYTLVKMFPSCGPSRSLGTIICTSLNLQCVRKLSCKYELFWLSGSWEENILMASAHIYIFVIISPWTRTWLFI